MKYTQLNLNYRYEKLGEMTANRPVKFLQIIKRKKDPYKSTKKMVANLMKAIHIVRKRVCALENEVLLLTMMSSPVLQKTLTLKCINSFGHMSFMEPDRVWVTDDDNNNLILIDTTTGNKLRSINDTLRETAYGFHTVNGYSNVYIDEHENVVISNQFFDREIILSKTYGLHSDFTPTCVYWPRFSKELLIGLHSRDTNTGMIIRLIDSFFVDFFPERKSELIRCVFPRFITENTNGDVVISDRGAVMVTERNGGLRFLYTGPSPKPGLDPGGICTDALSNILVCDGITKTIHMIDRDGVFLSYLLTRKSPGICNRPVSLTYDFNNHLLLVGSGDNTLSVYRYVNRRLDLVGKYKKASDKQNKIHICLLNNVHYQCFGVLSYNSLEILKTKVI